MNGRMKMCDSSGKVLLSEAFDNKELCKKLFDFWMSIGNKGDYIEIEPFPEDIKIIVGKKKASILKLPPKPIEQSKPPLQRLPTINHTPYTRKNSWGY